jgi:hypothetical protein
MLKRIHARYPSKCKNCSRFVPKGDSIFWGKSEGTYCLPCGDNFNAKNPNPVPNLVKSAPVPKGAEYSIDWAELKKFCLDFMKGNKPKFNDPSVNSRIAEFLVNPTVAFQGYTGGQVRDWMENGFRTEAIHGLGDFIPPIREKRKLQFVEEGDEFHLEMAYSGDDNYMSSWTKREVIPGIRLDIVYSMSGGTDAKVVNDFNRWVCKVAYSIESAGIDAAINYVNDSDFIDQREKSKYTVIRVKKENETTDYLSISPMLSPASYRTFLFVAIALHHNEKKFRVPMGLARPKRRTNWDIQYDAESRKISVFTPASPRHFNSDDMTAKLRVILKELKG